MCTSFLAWRYLKFEIDFTHLKIVIAIWLHILVIYQQKMAIKLACATIKLFGSSRSICDNRVATRNDNAFIIYYYPYWERHILYVSRNITTHIDIVILLVCKTPDRVYTKATKQQLDQESLLLL